MTWTKLSDDFDQHPKIIAAGPLAELLHIHGLIYCNRYLTDGHIPATAVRRLITVPEKRLVERLVELGIWLTVKDGYQIHDFSEYQSTRAKVLAERKQKSSAGQAGGLARAKAEGKHLDPDPVPEARTLPVPVSEPVPDPAPSAFKMKPQRNGADAAERLRGIAAQALTRKDS
jgi:hypothetical protein